VTTTDGVDLSALEPTRDGFLAVDDPRFTDGSVALGGEQAAAFLADREAGTGAGNAG
jgi:hypothetical protein